jgi:O-antigen/teichoic acid export membrane protein
VSAPETPDRDDVRRLDTRIVRSSGWVAVGYGGQQLLLFAGMLVLVRLLDPQDFGLVALASPFLIALAYLQESGLGSALIHRRKGMDRAASTVLVYSPVLAIGLYAIAYIAAPPLARFFDEPDFSAVLRALALLLPIRSLAIVPGALLERDLLFGIRARVELSSAVAQFALSIALALAGFGVWSLVIGQLVGSATSASLYWAYAPVRPSPRQASVGTLRELIRYGRFVSAGNLLTLANNTADSLVIGRVLGASQLGFYTIAFRLGTMPVTVISYIVGRPMFAVYSMLQSDIPAVRRAYVQNLQRIAILALPASVALAVAARPIVLGLFGERWSPSIVPLQLVALYGLTRAFVGPCGELFKGLGRPELNVVLGVAYALVAIPGLLILVPAMGLNGAPLALWLGQLAAGVPGFVIAMRMVRLSGRALASALAAPAAPAACVAIALLVAVELTTAAAPALSLVIVVAVGVGAYALGAAVFARGVIVPIWTSLRARGA